MKTIKIKNKKIGIGHPVYTIAEMACAHDGDIEKAKRLIDAAVEAKTDAVQLQFFSAKDLMTPDHEVYDLLLKIELKPDQWKHVYQYARQFDIDVFACTYDVPSAEMAITLKVDGIKLNSSDLSNPDLLDIIARSRIPYTLGTGASTIEEISQAIERSLHSGGDNIIIMHGVQNFPTDISNAHMNKIKMLRALFPFPVGYQDHTDASNPFAKSIDLIALGMGASVIEKHITLDRSEKGTDYQAALEPAEFKEFIKMIRLAEKAIGSEGFPALTAKDYEYRKFQKKSIVAAHNLPKGKTLTREDVLFMRTKIPGISPADFNNLKEKATILKNLKKYESITPEALSIQNL